MFPKLKYIEVYFENEKDPLHVDIVDLRVDPEDIKKVLIDLYGNNFKAVAYYFCIVEENTEYTLH